MSKDWWRESAKGLPELITETPEPKSKEMHANTARYMKGFKRPGEIIPGLLRGRLWNYAQRR